MNFTKNVLGTVRTGISGRRSSENHTGKSLLATDDLENKAGTFLTVTEVDARANSEKTKLEILEKSMKRRKSAIPVPPGPGFDPNRLNPERPSKKKIAETSPKQKVEKQ